VLLDLVNHVVVVTLLDDLVLHLLGLLNHFLLQIHAPQIQFLLVILASLMASYVILFGLLL
jgi:hypothetical protein